MTPIVLIGLGSKAVDTIYSMMDDVQKKSTVTAVLDTDAGNLQNLKGVEVKIQTSPNIKSLLLTSTIIIQTYW